MSCFLGAPATVYRWGYNYNGTPKEQYRFDAGIHAKRASYCGNGQFHTVSGVFIDLADDAGIAQSNAYINAPTREAVWTPRGAICLDPLYMRNYDIPRMPKFGPPYECPAGWGAVAKLTKCLPAIPPDPYVVSGSPSDPQVVSGNPIQ
jgi:hypothetical protein